MAGTGASEFKRGRLQVMLLLLSLLLISWPLLAAVQAAAEEDDVPSEAASASSSSSSPTPPWSSEPPMWDDPELEDPDIEIQGDCTVEAWESEDRIIKDCSQPTKVPKPRKPPHISA